MYYYTGEEEGGRSPPPSDRGVMALQVLYLYGTAVRGDVAGLAQAHGLQLLRLDGLSGVYGDLAALAGLTAPHDHHLIIMYHIWDASSLM